MTRSPLRPLESTATFEQTLGAVGDAALRTEADLAELALSAIFGATGAPSADLQDTRGQVVSGQIPSEAPPEGPSTLEAPSDSEAPSESNTPAAPESPAPRPSFSFGAPANDDLASVRLLSPLTIGRTARRLRIAVTLVPALLVGSAICICLAQVQLGRYDILPRLGTVLFTSGGALAIGVFLRDLLRMQAESLRAHTVEVRRMAERLWEAELRMNADGMQAKERSATLAAGIGYIAERIDHVVAAAESTPGAPTTSAPPASVLDDTLRQVLARFAALDARVSQGLCDLRNDVAASHADLQRSLDEMDRPEIASEREPPAPVAPKAMDFEAPDAMDFDLFCEGLLVLAEGSADSHRLRRARDLAGTTIEAIFDAAALLEVWDDYRRDGVAAFDDVYRGDGRHVVHRVRLQLQIDPLWRDAVETWLASYETRIMAAAQTGRNYPLMALLSSFEGRCYTLLAHASHRIESRDTVGRPGKPSATTVMRETNDRR